MDDTGETFLGTGPVFYTGFSLIQPRTELPVSLCRLYISHTPIFVALNGDGVTVMVKFRVMMKRMVVWGRMWQV